MDLEANSSKPEEDIKKKQLKKAGEEYFASVLEKAAKGKDPFVKYSSPSVGVPPRTGRTKQPTLPVSQSRPQREHQRVDNAGLIAFRTSLSSGNAATADLEAMGDIIKGARHYVAGLLWFASSGAGIVLIKESLLHLHAPAILLFFHLLPSVATLWVLHQLQTAPALTLGPFTARSFRGSLVPITLYGVQGLLLFAALLQGSLWLALAVSALAVPLLQAALHVRQRPTAAAPAAAALAGALGLALTGGAAYSAGPRVSQGLALVLLALWGALAAVRLAWQHVLREPTAVVDLAGEARGAQLAALAEADRDTSPQTSLFYQQAVSAVPVLLIGFVFREGNTLIDHELSVPAVQIMLISCLCWTTSTVTSLYFLKQLPQTVQRSLSSMLPLASLMAELVWHGAQGQTVQAVGAALSVGAAAALTALQTSA